MRMCGRTVRVNTLVYDDWVQRAQANAIRRRVLFLSPVSLLLQILRVLLQHRAYMRPDIRTAWSIFSGVLSAVI